LTGIWGYSIRFIFINVFDFDLVYTIFDYISLLFTIHIAFMHQFIRSFFLYLFYSYIEKNVQFLGVSIGNIKDIFPNHFSIISLNAETNDNNSSKEEMSNKSFSAEEKKGVGYDGTLEPWMTMINKMPNGGFVPKNLNKKGLLKISFYENNYVRGLVGVAMTKRMDPSEIYYAGFPSSINSPTIRELTNLDKYIITTPKEDLFKHKITLTVPYFGIDIGKFPISAFFPGHYQDRYLRGTIVPLAPVLKLKSEYMSTDQLNSALSWYALVGIADKEYFLKNYPQYKEEYDELSTHYKNSLFVAFQRNIGYDEYRKDKNNSSIREEIELYIKIDKAWEKIRLEYGETLLHNFKPHENKDNPWTYKQTKNNTWEKNHFIIRKKKKLDIPTVQPVWRD
jgi:hypothetical protein